MTNDEREAKKAEERRKLDRDMDRIERVLTKMSAAPRHSERLLTDDERWREFDRTSRKKFAEIKGIAARSDAKIKALIQDMEKRKDARRS